MILINVDYTPIAKQRREWDMEEVQIQSIALVKRASIRSFDFVDEARHTVFGLVLVPDTADTQNQTISKEQIRAAVDRWTDSPMTFTLDHDGPQTPVDVECFGIVNETTVEKYSLPSSVPLGSMYVIARLTELDFQRVIEGDYTGFSADGNCQLVKADEAVDVKIEKDELEVDAADLARVIIKAVEE